MHRPATALFLLAALGACAPPPEPAQDNELALELGPSRPTAPPMTTTPSSATRPPLDLRAPAITRTATFALG